MVAAVAWTLLSLGLAVQAGSTPAGDSFEAARPGSCCTLEPHTRITWSEFVAGGEAASNASGGLPVVIPCGHEVTLDESVQGLGGLQVMGSVKFQDDIDIQLETDHVLVCGRFSIGSPASRHSAKVEIVLTGTTDLVWPRLGGAKNFGKAPFVTYGGSLYIRGSACGTATWTRLSRSVGPAQVDHENVARGQAAAQSSIGHHRYTAAKGVDGSNNWKWGSMLTRREARPWWYVRVDTLSTSGAGRVTLTKRSRYGTDLKSVIVGVADAACQVGSLCGGTTCNLSGQRGSKYDFDCRGARGRFVYVQVDGTDTLSMAEVEVFAFSSGTTYELELQTEEPVAWTPGERLMITSTSHSALDTEEVTVVNSSPGRAAVSGALLKWHSGCSLDSERCVMAAEVASLNRNIVIRGRDGCGEQCGHFMIAHTERGFVCGAEFTNLGETKVEGRYPLHIHLPGEAPDLIVKDNALHHNKNRGLVMHGVHNMTVESNFCYKTKGHCFMTEDGVEQYNHIVRNLGVLVSPLSFGCSQSHDMTFTCAHRSDHNPNAFWISNPNNFFVGNVGVAEKGAFFIETRHVMGLVRRQYRSEAMKVGQNGKIKGSTPLAQFSNNTAHSSGMGLGNYPRIGFAAGGRNVYESFTAWRCGDGMSVHTGGSTVPISEARLVENTAAVRAGHPTNKIRIERSTMTARPDWSFVNKGTRYVSAPLIMNAFGKTRASQLSSIFTIDSDTRNWVGCHSNYDVQALAYSQPRGDWFTLFQGACTLV